MQFLYIDVFIIYKLVQKLTYNFKTDSPVKWCIDMGRVSWCCLNQILRCMHKVFKKKNQTFCYFLRLEINWVVSTYGYVKYYITVYIFGENLYWSKSSLWCAANNLGLCELPEEFGLCEYSPQYVYDRVLIASFIRYLAHGLIRRSWGL